MTVKLLTIGEFARAARLSPKALRLYDELGLLHPARDIPAPGNRRSSSVLPLAGTGSHGGDERRA